MNAPETDLIWHWQAADKRRSVARDYQLRVSQDLFGWFIVEQRWGRIGTAGQGRTIAFAEPGEAARHIAAVKARRESANRRLGVGYREVHQAKQSVAFCSG